MRVKITVDFDDDGEEHPLLHGIDVDFDFKKSVDRREVTEAIVAAVRKTLWT